jgi:hypothetical protein
MVGLTTLTSHINTYELQIHRWIKRSLDKTISENSWWNRSKIQCFEFYTERSLKVSMMMSARHKKEM